MTMTMLSLWSLLHTPTVELLGWTLLHFVWQGALVAAVLAGALYLLRTHSPRVRYVVSCAALLGLLVLPVGTGAFLGGSGVSPALSLEGAAGTSSGAVTIADVPRASAGEPAAAGLPSWRARVVAWVQPALPWIVLTWGLGVLGFALRLGGGAWRVRRVRRSSSPAPSEWQERLRALADRMGVGYALGLRRSDRVDGPVLAGWWRPVILVPAGFLSGLPPAQVEALLLHELAHVRRHDVLVGRLQAVVETLLFFHPATWWISQQVRRAREACCDDLVVQAGSERTTYAQALTALAERAVEGPPTAWAPAATDGSLLDRIQRLVVPPEAPSTAGRRLSIVAAAVLMVIVPVGLAACASQQSSTGETSSGTAASGGEETPPSQGREHRESTIVSVRDDSSRRVITLRAPETVGIDSLDDGSYVLRSERGDVDTLRIPHPEAIMSLDVSGEERQSVPDSVRLARHFPRLRLGSDSLGRVVVGNVNPDSLKRLIQTRFDADSLKRVLRERFDLDSLDHRALQVRWQSDSLARSLRGRILDDELGDWPADSLRRHFEKMHERMELEVPEHLREEARRLREQAQELEEQAEEMERRREKGESGASG